MPRASRGYRPHEIHLRLPAMARVEVPRRKTEGLRLRAKEVFFASIALSASFEEALFSVYGQGLHDAADVLSDGDAVGD